MGLARIAVATLAVVLAVGLLVVGGVALYGALSRSSKSATGTPSAAPTTRAARTRVKAPPAPSNTRVGNTVEIQCLAAQCPVYVAGPGPNDVQFNGTLIRNERRVFNEIRLTVAVDDASTVSVIINGRPQPRGRAGQQKTYEVPASQ